MPARMRLLACLLACAVLVARAEAWVADPLLNSLLSPRTVSLSSGAGAGVAITADGNGGVWLAREFGGGTGVADSLELMHFDRAGARSIGWPSAGVIATAGPYLFDSYQLLQSGKGVIVLNQNARTMRRFLPDGSSTTGASGITIRAPGDLRGVIPAAFAAEDGAGGVFVVWGDSRGTYLKVAVIQRFDSTGAGTWNGGVPAELESTGVAYPMDLVRTASGGVIVGWCEPTNVVASTGFVARVQCVSATGQRLWARSGVLAYPGTGEDLQLKLASDGGAGAFIAIARAPSFTRDTRKVILGHLLSDGTRDPAWPDTGVVIENADPNSLGLTGMLPESDGGALLSWSTGRSYPEHVLRVAANGAVLWQSVYLPGGAESFIADGHDGAWWAATRSAFGSGGSSSETDIAIGHVSASGVPLLSDMPLSTASGYQSVTTACSDSGGGVIVAWRDFRNDPNGDLFQVYGQNVNADGSLGGTVVATQASLLSSEVNGDKVSLRWVSPSRQQRYEAERRDGDGAWQVVAADLLPDGTGAVTLEDRVPAPGEYSYRLVWIVGGQRVMGPSAGVRVAAQVAFTLTTLTDVASRRVALRYSLPSEGLMRLELFDVTGRLVRVFREASARSGEHTLWWDGRDDRGVRVPHGLYFARLRTSNASLETKLVPFAD